MRELTVKDRKFTVEQQDDGKTIISLHLNDTDRLTGVYPTGTVMELGLMEACNQILDQPEAK